jgi:hypothetical protein
MNTEHVVGRQLPFKVVCTHSDGSAAIGIRVQLFDQGEYRTGWPAEAWDGVTAPDGLATLTRVVPQPEKRRWKRRNNDT